jgi:hypothetical protein
VAVVLQRAKEGLTLTITLYYLNIILSKYIFGIFKKRQWLFGWIGRQRGEMVNILFL